MNFFLKILLTLFFAISFVSWSHPAHAFTCFYQDFHERYKAASTVFLGNAIQGDDNKCGSKKMLFEVVEIYKGLPKEKIWVHTKDACSGSGVYLNKKNSYLVFGKKLNDATEDISVWGCSGTRPLEYEKEGDIDALKEKKNQQDALLKLLKSNDDNRDVILESIANYLIYWQDYESLEHILLLILKENPEEKWVLKELLKAYYQQHKFQEIWDFFIEKKLKLDSEHDQEIANIFTHTLLSLKKISKHNQYRLQDVHLNDITLESQTIQYLFFKNVTFKNTAMQNLKIENGQLRNISFYESDFSNSIFKEVNMANNRFFFN